MNGCNVNHDFDSLFAIWLIYLENQFGLKTISFTLPTCPYLLDDLSSVNEHQQALTATLLMPDNTDTLVAFSTGCGYHKVLVRFSMQITPCTVGDQRLLFQTLDTYRILFV